jgi:hypothetical protein
VQIKPELSLRLRCPRCLKLLFTPDPQFGAIFSQCGVSSCRQRWWFMVLSPGDVRPQLAATFGEDFAPTLMRLYVMPRALDAVHFWQVPISGSDYHAHRRLGMRDFAARFLNRFFDTFAA